MVHNGLVYLRGNPTDYDNWAPMGNVGWSWGHVKPFLLKGETNGKIDRVGSFWHATGGPVSVERLPYQPPLTNSILTAAMETGVGISEDLNGDQLTGLSVVQTTSKDGVRRSSATAYLWPVRHRKNLQISLNSTCTRVIIENKIAVGVEYYHNDKFLTVRAAREVIVFAGTIASPQLLLLCGIGPKKHLDSVGVRVVQDLPGIGENFQDQIMYNLQYTLDESDIYDNNWAAAFEDLWPFRPVLFLATDLSKLWIFASGYVAGCAPGELDALQSTGKRTVTPWPVYHHTRSRGRISLASNNPFDKPVIWSNVLSEPADVAGLIEAINITLKLANTDALKAHNFTLSTTPMDVCSDHPFLSTEYWVCALRQSVVPRAHTGGTCKMGPSSDPMAVVDPQLRVYGVGGLRVADASIMPMVTFANTAGPTMMIGERAAGLIKKHSMQNFQRGCLQ
ncbi:glucose dehydrogenase [FAD, quinone]-like [Neodiprion pinetum]|uniref:glucose dehydrogenase [FAD, quinone]-like n=1 Tax=Neodiprion pinetum TaxID=441929 RepID=UPI003711C040